MMRGLSMEAAWRRLRALRMPEWSALALLFVVCFYAFGLLLARLGFFQDDWHHVFHAYWYGTEGLKRFLLTDRGPVSYLVYAAYFKLLGFTPANWHWTLSLVRFLTAAMFWLALRQIWPAHKSLTAWLALLFVIYPIFALQPLSVAYMLHWSMYLVFMLSLFLMLYAVRNRKAYVPLTIAAVLLQAYELVSIEYFSGLEIARPIFLWLLFTNLPTRERIRKTIQTSLPFVVTALIYAGYRAAYSRIYGFDRFGLLNTLSELVHAPLQGAARVVQFMVQDLVFVIIGPWYSTIDPNVLDLSRASTYVIFGSAIAVAVLAYFVISWLKSDPPEPASARLGLQIASAGFLSVVVALFPFWVAGLSIFRKNQLWSDRLALAAMPGAGMLVVGLATVLIERPRIRNMVLAALVGLSISPAVQTARSYQASWDKQQQFYWELHWRAPALQPGTMVVSDQEVLFFMGNYPTTFALNVLYPQQKQWPDASYWFDSGTERISVKKFSAGEPTQFHKYTEVFTARRDGVLAIFFQPEFDQCLWVARPEYTDLRDISETAKMWVEMSNTGRIQDGPESVPPPAIFGSEPSRGWCYYFEKADLARQYQKWDTVLQLWKEAGKQQLRAHTSVELLPFIEAFARSGDWDSARKLTIQGEALPDRSTSVTCSVWRGLGTTTAASAQRDESVAAVLKQLGCASQDAGE